MIRWRPDWWNDCDGGSLWEQWLYRICYGGAITIFLIEVIVPIIAISIILLKEVI
jgi:hypothetical protein